MTALARRDTLLLGIRVVLVVLAVVAAALPAPTWLSTPAVALAAVVVLVPLVRLRDRGGLDAVLVGAAGLLIVPALLGLVLDAVPGGLTRVSWALGFGAVLLAGLVWTYLWGRGRRGAPRLLAGGAQPADRRRRLIRETPWFVGAAALLVTAIVVATQSARRADERPLALSVVGTRAGGTVELAVSAGQQGARFTLTVRSGTDAGTRASTTTEPFEVDRFSTVRRSVRVPSDRDATVTLQIAGATNALRTLTFDDTGDSKR